MILMCYEDIITTPKHLPNESGNNTLTRVKCSRGKGGMGVVDGGVVNKQQQRTHVCC